MTKQEKILVAATSNEHKIEEISAIAGAFGYRVISRAEAGIPEFEIEEDGETFEENSLLKARVIFDWLGRSVATIADDSGLEVDAIGGAPGVYSARFAMQAEAEAAAEESDDVQDFAVADKNFAQAHRSRQDLANNAKLLRLLEGVPLESRTARFVSVITCLRPGLEPLICRGEVEGHIDYSETGTAGFGYDPLFIPTGFKKSFGLFAPDEKNAISHRGNALALLSEKLNDDE